MRGSLFGQHRGGRARAAIVSGAGTINQSIRAGRFRPGATVQWWKNGINSGLSSVAGSDGYASLNIVAAGGDAWAARGEVESSPYLIPQFVALQNLTVTPTTGVAGAPFSGSISGKTSGSSVAIQSVSGPAGAWGLVGGALTGSGLAEGNHQITLVETYTGAINDGRQSVISINISPASSGLTGSPIGLLATLTRN